MSRTAADFEVLRFEAVPAVGAVAVLELEGLFAHGPPRRTRLLVERGGGSAEVPAVIVTEHPWTATFAIALDDLADPATEYALAPDRGALLALPAPTRAGEQDKYVRMARTANELRHRMTERAEAAAAAEDRAGQLAADRDRLGEELASVRAELEAAIARAASAEESANACRAQRDSAVASGDERAAELEASRAQTRAAEQRADAAERDAAAQRARADAAERDSAAQRDRADDEKARADDLDLRLVAAEDEVRAARRELRDTRARLESLLRERRGHPAARRPETGEHDVGSLSDDTGDHEAADAGEDETTPMGTVEPAGEGDAVPADDTRDEPVAPAGDDEDEGARFTSGPRSEALATRPTRTVRIWDDPSDTGEDDVVSENGGRPGDKDAMDPGAVGARYIEPSTTRAPQLTRERLIVGGILLLLFLVLLLILLGVV